MKTALLLLFLSASLSADTWELVWSDEFNTPGVPDSSLWSFDTEGNSWDWGNNEKQNYTKAGARNAWVEEGKLIIEARRERNRASEDGEVRDYSSARLRSLNKGDWIQGKFEIRARLPKGTGTWPAIWMLPSDDSYGGWPHSGEIDIMEAIGSEPTTHYSTVWNTVSESTHGNGSTLELQEMGEQFHTYTLEWYSDSLLFFVDRKQVHTYRNEKKGVKQWPFDRRFHLLMNVAVGGDWEKNVDPASFPARLEVDYVRVYQQRNSAEGNIYGSLWMKRSDSGIEFRQSEGCFATVKLSTPDGKLVSEKELGFLDAGTHGIPFDPALPAGEYVVQLNSSDGVGKMTVVTE